MSEMNREKGAETGTTSCPNCGSELALAPQADGSVAAEPCGTCYGEAKGDEQAVNSGNLPPAPPQELQTEVDTSDNEADANQTNPEEAP